LKTERLIQHLRSNDLFEISPEDAAIAVEEALQAKNIWSDFVWIPGESLSPGEGPPEIGASASMVLWLTDESNAGKDWSEYLKLQKESSRKKPPK